MSRIGLMPVIIPDGVKVEISPKNEVKVEGKKGKLIQHFNEKLKITKDNNIIKVARPEDNNFYKSLHGLTTRLINNMIIGVTTGFNKKLEINGIGFRAQISGKTLTMQLGYSHPIVYQVPDGIEIVLGEPNSITVNGFDKQKVGHVAATIRSFKEPEPYKLKGIKVEGEYIRRKAGKSVKK
ncbi:MAG: 50S ribosomal protein L6 [Candidatus Firestonebacteria bacterium]|nr:50S ribosomal protein L6 [Candidatus Firestonebacteria bacterium]